MRLGDLRWTLCPLVSFLHATGGWQIKGIRRLGIPLAICIYCLLYYRAKVKHNLIMLTILFLALFGALTLPLTAIGDKMNKMNVAWSFILGYINIAVLYPITQLKREHWDKVDSLSLRWFYGAYVMALIYGFTILASYNFNWFEHKWTEIIAGLCIGFMAAYLIKED